MTLLYPTKKAQAEYSLCRKSAEVVSCIDQVNADFQLSAHRRKIELHLPTKHLNLPELIRYFGLILFLRNFT